MTAGAERDAENRAVTAARIDREDGAVVEIAQSADAALELFDSWLPDMIISDIGMPETDGYQLLTQLRHLPGLGEVPAIAISGYATEEDRERALSVGYLALVPKPVDIEVLFNLIEELKTPAV